MYMLKNSITQQLINLTHNLTSKPISSKCILYPTQKYMSYKKNHQLCSDNLDNDNARALRRTIHHFKLHKIRPSVTTYKI